MSRLSRPPIKLSKRQTSAVKASLGLLAVAIIIAAYWLLAESGYLSVLTDEERLRSEVASFGVWGIFAVIALITVAIVMSPIPSGPIAMVAGAVYGPLFGAIYTIIGSVLGAALAFGIARFLGYEFVRRRFHEQVAYLSRNRSQNRLMGIVFVSRLVPFISFDAVSYAAGLTPLSFVRFIIATFIGVIPIAIVLTFFGDRLMMADSKWTIVTTLVVGGLTLLPIGVKWLSSGRRKWKRR